MSKTVLRNIRLVNWYGFTNTTIPVSENLTLISGENECGKSTILDAVKYAYTGDTQFNKATSGYNTGVGKRNLGDHAIWYSCVYPSYSAMVCPRSCTVIFRVLSGSLKYCRRVSGDSRVRIFRYPPPGVTFWTGMLEASLKIILLILSSFLSFCFITCLISLNNAYLSDLISNLKLSHTFSISEEIDTGEAWVDGKRIYRKVIKTTDTISANETLALYWDTINCSEIWIDLQNSYIRSPDSGQVYPLCVQFQDYFTGAWVNKNGIRLYSNSGWNESWTKVITVRYTKV